MINPLKSGIDTVEDLENGLRYRRSSMSRGVHPYPISLLDVLSVALSWFLMIVFFGYVIRWMCRELQLSIRKKGATKIVKDIFKKLGITGIRLTQYETEVATNLVIPTDINVSWDCIAGLDDTIQELKETLLFPILKKDIVKDTKLIQPPNGVLLHGPPGCGKTMIAKALAKEVGARFLNLDVSTLTNKWYGESEKLAHAVFTLSVKLQPTIIFLDEIESFLRCRTMRDHEATALLKAQFLSLWDGLSTDHQKVVVVIGATNRPDEVDKAILRRMPCRFHIALPNEEQRKCILQLMLKDEPLMEDVDVSAIAKMTDGFSGSDLQELCRIAALLRIRDLIKAKTQGKDKEWEEMPTDVEKISDEKEGESEICTEPDLTGAPDASSQDTVAPSNVVEYIAGQGDGLLDSTVQSQGSPNNTTQMNDALTDDSHAEGTQGLRGMAMADFIAALLKIKSSNILSKSYETLSLGALSKHLEVENSFATPGGTNSPF